MDKEKLALRREGYADALVSKEFIDALKKGHNGKLAITYFEWASSDYQKVIVPWRVIDGPEAAAVVAAEIMKTSPLLRSRTSISAAIKFAMSQFERSPYRSSRRLIDISGDGANNNGEPVEGARDAALAKGVTINGLPMTLGEPPRSPSDIDNLELYYEDCVTGGPHAVVMTVNGRDKLKEAIKTMLVREVAGLAPERPNGSTEREKRISCLAGEKAYESIWGKPSGRPLMTGHATTSSIPAWRHAEFAAHIRKCFLRHKEPIRSRVDVSATFGPDGMIVGDPEIKDPIDSDAFRRDARTALKKIRQCQPYIVDPFARTRTQLTQEFRFGRKAPEEDINATICAHFKKCWTAPRTGPTIQLWLHYKPDGTYSGNPILVNPKDTPEYSRNAAKVVRQLTNCPPLKIPKEKYELVKTLNWKFFSHESARAEKRT